MNRKISIIRLFSLIALHALLAMFLGGKISVFINIPSIVIIIGGTFLMLLATYQMSLFQFVKNAAIDSISKDVLPNKKYKEIARSARNYFLTFGILGAIICLIQSFWTFNDIYNIFPSIAVSLLTLLYGVFLGNILCIFLEKIYSE